VARDFSGTRDFSGEIFQGQAKRDFSGRFFRDRQKK
jgi:hypothetical protein